MVFHIIPEEQVSVTREPEERIPLTHVAYHILLAVADRPLHGYGIIKEVERRTDGRTRLEAGTLYAAIKRLREQGLIDAASSEAGDGDDDGEDDGDGRGPSRGRAYSPTDFGREVLEAETRRLQQLVDIARSKRVIPGDSSA